MTTASHPHELVEHIGTLTKREYEAARSEPEADIHIVARQHATGGSSE